MKHIPLLKSTLGLLVLAGASLPLPTVASTERMEPMWSYSDSAAYDNLRQIQAYKSEPVPAGMQGPIRTESMGPVWSSDDGAAYDNLRRIQSSRTDKAPEGAQGPVRTDSMSALWIYRDGETYSNLRRLQSGN